MTKITLNTTTALVVLLKPVLPNPCYYLPHVPGYTNRRVAMCPSTSTLHTLSWYKPSRLVRTKVGWFLSKYLGIPDCYLVHSQILGTLTDGWYVQYSCWYVQYSYRYASKYIYVTDTALIHSKMVGTYNSWVGMFQSNSTSHVVTRVYSQ